MSKFILLIDAWDRGSEEWIKRVETTEQVFAKKLLKRTNLILNPGSFKGSIQPASKTEGWIIDTLEGEFERVTQEQINSLREAGKIQEAWNLKEARSLQEIEDSSQAWEKIGREIKVTTARKKFGL